MITVVTKSYCPFCSGAIRFLESIWQDYREIEISRDPSLYEKYKNISGMHTVPQIFFWEPTKDSLIGGYDDMMSQYKSGKIFKK